jgi:hypothetical protein
MGTDVYYRVKILGKASTVWVMRSIGCENNTDVLASDILD